MARSEQGTVPFPRLCRGGNGNAPSLADAHKLTAANEALKSLAETLIAYAEDVAKSSTPKRLVCSGESGKDSALDV